MLGLPEGIRACLFDLDGVLTDTATLHAAAWKQMFDEYLCARAEGRSFEPFDSVADYDKYVDGRPRYEGVHSFLESRGIELPQGTPEDRPGAETIDGLGSHKNEILLRLVHVKGVRAFPGSVRYVHAVASHGFRRAVVSSSTNCRDVLAAAGIQDLFEEIIDGHTAERSHIAGKPAPDTYLAGARALAIDPALAAVFEDALAGVEAGRRGNFGFVVGVDRVGQAEELKARGADVVVRDLADLLPEV